ncbi:MAG TPA: ATP-binding cassette domain-containing protein, partial [Rhizomicrobium sp.]|nr:ATP-binding cassette domain-containing protein [Rhizomicrobium sp.]
MIALGGVGKRFSPNQKNGGTEALRDVSFTVGAGEFVSLLGPSGCGKSTALRLVAGLLQPDSGTITYPQGKPEIGFVF